MKCLFLTLLFAAAFCEIPGISRYTKKDLEENKPVLIFIHYEGQNKEKCMACEGYKKWLSTKNGTIPPYAIKEINFATHPIMALRFKTTRFPTFFLQHRQKFKNISDVDFSELEVSYGSKTYDNDIDAILKNPEVLDKIPTLEGIFAPSSSLTSMLAFAFALFLWFSYVTDIIDETVPSSLLLTVFAVAGLLVLAKQRKKEGVEEAAPSKGARKKE